VRKLTVQQRGLIQVEVERTFAVEVPDDMTEEQAQELLENMDDSLSDDEGMAWEGGGKAGGTWIGYDVEVEETEVHDPALCGGWPKPEGLTVIRLGGIFTTAVWHALTKAGTESGPSS
jgi:hypothetical protein